MTIHRDKTSTDTFWNAQPDRESDTRKVNIADLAQRRLENAFLFPHLQPADRVLEVGCGNGFLTGELRERVAWVDAFDFAEGMVDSARRLAGERNNRFFVESVLNPNAAGGGYDVVVCVRVLINLASLEEQALAIENIAGWLKADSRLLLVEGFADGFGALNDLRTRCGISPLAPASINCYSREEELMPAVRRFFDVDAEWHSGMFDVLTRIAYPLLAGADVATGYSDFHDKTLPLALALNPGDFRTFARLRGFVLRRR